MSQKNYHFSRKTIADLEIIATFAPLFQNKRLERCSSGWRGTPGKRVAGKTGSQVRILFSPQRKRDVTAVTSLFFVPIGAAAVCGAHGAPAAQQNVFPIRIFYPEKPSTPSTKQPIYLYINWLQVYSLRLQPVTGDGLGIILNVPPHQWQEAFPSQQTITITGIIFTPCLKVFAISKQIFPIIREKFITKFVTRITKFVICVTKFVTSIRKCVTKICCARRKKFLRM